MSKIGKVKIMRNEKREGLIRTRLSGVKAARGQVIVVLDSHVEVYHNWLPPLLQPIVEDRNRFFNDFWIKDWSKNWMIEKKKTIINFSGTLFFSKLHTKSSKKVETEILKLIFFKSELTKKRNILWKINFLKNKHFFMSFKIKNVFLIFSSTNCVKN